MNMKEQKFGVEIEMVIDRGTVAKALAEHFGTEARYVGGSYRAWVVTGADGRVWKVMRDGSILAADAKKCELVTPILEYGDLDELQTIVRMLRGLGARSSAAAGCGVHIHVDASAQNARSLRHLANTMCCHEDLLISALGISEQRLNTYCRRADPVFIRRLNDEKPATMAELADVWYESHSAGYSRTAHYNSSRYHMVNFHSVFTKGTVEFRFFEFSGPDGNRQNGLHAGQLKAWVQFCLAVCAGSTTARWTTPEHGEWTSPRKAMRDWLTGYSLRGEEFATCRDVFTRALPTRAGTAAAVRTA